MNPTPTILIPLHRDQLRAVQKDFCPYFEMYCESKAKLSVNESERLIYMIIRSLFLDFYKLISKKLLTDNKQFKLKVSEATAIAIYKLLLALPIKVEQVWLHNLRQTLINIIHSQLQQPDHEPNPKDDIKEFHESIDALKKSLKANFGLDFDSHVIGL